MNKVIGMLFGELILVLLLDSSYFCYRLKGDDLVLIFVLLNHFLISFFFCDLIDGWLSEVNVTCAGFEAYARKERSKLYLCCITELILMI